MNDERSIQLLHAMAERLSDNPDFMAHAMAVYRRRRKIDEAELAYELGALPVMLLRLALCRRPASDAPGFAERMRELSDFTLIDGTRIASVLQLTEAPAPAQPESFAARVFAALAELRHGIGGWLQRPAPLAVAASCIALLIVAGVFALRERRPQPAPLIAAASPQPATTPLVEPSLPASPTPGELLVVAKTFEFDLESYAALRGAEIPGGEIARAIRLPASPVRLKLKLPERAVAGRYSVGLLAERDRVLVSASTRSGDGKTLVVLMDLSKVETKQYRLRVWRASGAPDFYPVTIIGAQ